MPQQKQRHTRILLAQLNGQRMHILHQRGTGIPHAEMPPLLRPGDRLAVSHMVVSRHQKALLGQILRKRLVPLHIFDHSMGYLHNGARRALRPPANAVQRVLTGGRGKRKGVLCHSDSSP